MNSSKLPEAGPPRSTPETPTSGTDDTPEGDAEPADMSGAVSYPSRTALEELVRGTEVGMLLADAETRVLYANQAAASLFGTTPADMIGRPGVEFAPPDHLFMGRSLLAEALETPGEPVSGSLEVKTADGGRATLDVRIVNHLSTPGVEAFVAHLQRSVATAGERADSYRALFDNALLGMGVADMRGNLLAFNDAMLEPGGYTREDIERIGNVGKLYAEESDRARVLQLLRAKGYVWREPVPFLGKDGSTYETRLTLTPVVFMGRPCLYAMTEVMGDER